MTQVSAILKTLVTILPVRRQAHQCGRPERHRTQALRRLEWLPCEQTTKETPSTRKGHRPWCRLWPVPSPLHLGDWPVLAGTCYA